MSTPTDLKSTSGRHPVNVTHLVMGLVFLGIAGSWSLRELDVIDAEGGRWILPVILVLAGGAGLVAAVARGISRNRQEPVEDQRDESDADPLLHD